VKVAQDPQHLPRSRGRLKLRELAGLDEPRVQLAALATLHHQVHFLVRLVDGFQPRDVRVVEAEVNFHLVHEEPELLLRHLALRERLQGVLPIAAPSSYRDHLYVGALTQNLGARGINAGLELFPK